MQMEKCVGQQIVRKELSDRWNGGMEEKTNVEEHGSSHTFCRMLANKGQEKMDKILTIPDQPNGIRLPPSFSQNTIHYAKAVEDSLYAQILEHIRDTGGIVAGRKKNWTEQKRTAGRKRATRPIWRGYLDVSPLEDIAHEHIST